MTTQPIQAALELTRRVYDEHSKEGQVCSYVFSRLTQLISQFDRVSLGSVATALGWQNDQEGRKAVVKALDMLTFGEVQIFERIYELWPQDCASVLIMPMCEISDDDLRDALEVGYIVADGVEVYDFLDRITVSYVVTNDARDLASAKEL